MEVNTSHWVDDQGSIPTPAGRTFLLDTNVLLHDADSLSAFEEHNIVLTVDVLEELDRFKRGNDERGRNARRVIRTIDSFRDGRPLSKGVDLPGGGKLFVFVKSFTDFLPKGMDKSQPDNRILAAACALVKAGSDVFFVTKDINARVKADALGIQAQDYLNRVVNFDELYTGWSEHEVPDEIIDRFYRGEPIQIEDPLCPNECVLLKAASNPKQTARGIFRTESGIIEPLQHGDSHPWGLTARNLQQHFAMELLLREDIHLVTMLGQAGTGKTLLALAAGLQLVAEEKRYRRIMVSRPIMPWARTSAICPEARRRNSPAGCSPFRTTSSTWWTPNSNTPETRSSISTTRESSKRKR